ncbi:MAG TPA: hypothetical protein VGH89_10780 [Pseudonocardia sp.]|jgi:hypothetical protein
MNIRRTLIALASPPSTPARIASALCLASTGFMHAQLYVHGYRAIPWIGPMFLLQAAGALAVGLLLLIAGPGVLRLAAVGLSAGALVGFVLSRTVGVFGFVERGFDPQPQALLTLLTELAVLALLAWAPARQLRT